jgi:hypothetical protein
MRLRKRCVGEQLHAHAPPARCGSRQDKSRAATLKRDATARGAAGRAYAKANF